MPSRWMGYQVRTMLTQTPPHLPAIATLYLLLATVRSVYQRVLPLAPRCSLVTLMRSSILESKLRVSPSHRFGKRRVHMPARAHFSIEDSVCKMFGYREDWPRVTSHVPEGVQLLEVSVSSIIESILWFFFFSSRSSYSRGSEKAIFPFSAHRSVS